MNTDNCCASPMKEPEKSYDMKYEQEFRKTFSKTILKQKLEEFKAGKFTKRYMEVYLDFVHLEGILDNVAYLEYKNKLEE